MMIKNKTFSVLLILLTVVSYDSISQKRWGMGDGYITYGGEPVYLSGANYTPPVNWMLQLEKDRWNAEAVEADMKALSEIGVNCIRFFPLWNLAQPKPDRLDRDVLERMDKLIELAGKHGVFVQISPITGFMSGGLFLPKWAEGNIFTEPKLIEAQQFLVGEIAKRYRDNPYVMGYDFGNEINVMRRHLGLDATEMQIDAWMQAIYTAFKEGAQDKPVTNGIGTGFANLWNVENIARSSDYLSIHSYPSVHGTYLRDPFVGLRTTYSSSYITTWAEKAGKPVMIQELGIPTGVMPIHDIYKFLQLTYLSNWADGAIGYLWWDSHNFDPNFVIETEALHKDLDLKNGKLGYNNYIMALLDQNNRPRAFAGDFKRCVDLVDKLDLGWKNKLPVCYILLQTGADQKQTMLHYINPYVLAKQIHMDVKFLQEENPVPEDAAGVVIAGYSLSGRGKENVMNYLVNGGVVYQSYYNDISENINAGDTELEVENAVLMASSISGDLYRGQHIRMSGKIKLKEVSAKGNTETVLAYPWSEEEVYSWRYSRNGVYFRTNIGKGAYYYMAANPEEALINTYDPWDTNDMDAVYSVLRPASDIDIDNKYVELYHLEKEGKELVMLLNHVNRFEDVALRSNKDIALRDAETDEPLGSGNRINLRIGPGGIKVAYVDKK